MGANQLYVQEIRQFYQLLQPPPIVYGGNDDLMVKWSAT